MDRHEEIRNQLIALYGEHSGEETFNRLEALMESHHHTFSDRRSHQRGTLTECEAIMMTYGDQVNEPGAKPLQSLKEFCNRYIKNLVSGVHILPFFPYSSDDGFSVIDYTRVDPRLGTWDDISALGREFRLMFDLVLNHVSAQSDWFKGFLQGDAKFRDFFIEVEGNPDLSMVVRPRALPLLTEFETADGWKKLWTTFSTDQIDLNYHSPDVLLKIIEIVLYYVQHGAEFLRLDAIAYLWKETGTTCIHLPQTHEVIRLLRAVLDSLYPQVFIITETNVSHQENLSYFGDGSNEAQLVYNFALPPLVLHTLQTGSSRALTGWASKLQLPSSEVALFNFLASHDGIGLNPVRGILTENEIDAMVGRIANLGGLVSYKQNPDGSRTPYELNINYFDALSDPEGDEGEDLEVARFMVAQAIMLAIAGLPGIYFHSLFGSRGWPEGVKLTGRNRTINRQKFDRANLERELQDTRSLRYQIFEGFSRLLAVRCGSTAFHPAGQQDILEWGEKIFVLKRTSPDEQEKVLCIHNVTNQPQSTEVDWGAPSGSNPVKTIDLLTGQQELWAPGKAPFLQPYQVAWLKII